MTEFEDISLEEMISDGFDIVAQEINIDDLAETEKNSEQKIFPILPVRNMVMFPNVVIPITAGRKASIQLLEEAQKNGDFIGIVSQKNSDLEQPSEKDLYQTGTLAKIIKIIKLPEGNITAITKGFHRFKIKKVVETQPYFKAEISKLKDSKPKNKEEYEALLENVKDLALKIIELDPNIPNAANFAIKNINNNDDLLNFICTNANFPSSDKQKLLEEKNLMERANKCYEMMHEDFRKLELRN
ncbi:MAG: LON peptidase substrate-binding domain-containing protein, partial [Chryseobacterium gambrini]|nr:LON peptidase substrate-binding domain-containing protein [Chryseobacterium gambrini]